MLPLNTNYCKCSGCGEYFGGVKGFDMHRIGVYPDRRCLYPGDVADKHGRPKLRLDDRGYWIGSYKR